MKRGLPSIAAFFILVLITGISVCPIEVLAQAEGWSEEKYVTRSSSLDNRVQWPAIAADGDNIYITYVQRTLKFVSSNDRGKTWSEPKDIAPTYRDCSAPAIIYLDGKIAVVWPARVESQGVIAYQLFAVQSDDKGQSWSDPKKIRTSRDDTFSPKFLKQGNQAKLLWLETPLSDMLGKVAGGQAINYNPESVEELAAFDMDELELQNKLRRTRSKFYINTYNPNSGAFSEATPITTIFSQRVPHIFDIYGPISGSLFIVANENTQINIYESEDDGATWSSSYEDKSYFDTKMLLDLHIIDGNWVSTWIRRDPYQQIPVNFRPDQGARDIELSPPHYVRSVPHLTFSDGIYHICWEAGSLEDSWITYMRTDEIPPTSNIIQPTSPAILERDVMFVWEGNDNISSSDRLEYSFTYGDNPWSPLQSETRTTFDTPPDGEYVFKLRAEDVAGNIQDPITEFPFNTFMSAPETQIVDAPPTGQPLKQRQVKVTFTGEDNTDPADQLMYSAKVDDQPWSAFTKGNEHTFTELSNGRHVLRIKLRDTNGNEDPTPTEMVVNVQIDLEIMFEQVPEEYSNAETITFRWESKDDRGQTVDLTYLYTLDNNEVQQTQEKTLELTELEEGKHTITLWGKDDSGDETNKISHEWILDRTPPETTASFANEYVSNLPIINLTVQDPMLGESLEPPKPNQFEYKIGEEEWVPFTHEASTWPAERKLSFYSWGYVIQIRAIDEAGNVDPTPAKVDLRIWVRTNPYIFYGVIAVIVIVLLYVLKLLLGMFGGGGKRVSKAKKTSFDTGAESEESSLDLDEEPSSTSYSFDDDDDENDPYKM